MRQEWALIWQVPLVLCLVWTLGLIVIWLLVDKLYRRRIETRDDILRMYQEKLGLGPFKKRPYSKLKNPELRNKATQLAQSIQAFTAMAGSQISAESADPSRSWLYIASQYSNEFRVASVLLRDEMLSRLPKSTRGAYDPKGTMAFVYQNPVHTHAMGMVADDLDKLAKMLPS